MVSFSYDDCISHETLRYEQQKETKMSFAIVSDT